MVNVLEKIAAILASTVASGSTKRATVKQAVARLTGQKAKDTFLSVSPTLGNFVYNVAVHG